MSRVYVRKQVSDNRHQILLDAADIMYDVHRVHNNPLNGDVFLVINIRNKQGRYLCL